MPDLRSKHLKQLCALLPGFAEHWHANSSSWGSDADKHTISGVFAAASRLVADRLVVGDAADIPKILNYIESVLESAAQEEKDAAATSFLENLLNRTPTEIAPNLWIPILGPKSRDFCRAWDSFTGCRTEFLHERNSG